MSDERILLKKRRLAEIEAELKVIKAQNRKNYVNNFLSDNFGIDGFYRKLSKAGSMGVRNDG